MRTESIVENGNLRVATRTRNQQKDAFWLDEDPAAHGLVLLLTQDRELEATLSEMLPQAHVLVVRDLDHALQFICLRGHEFNVAVIDFDDCCHGMTLLSAIKSVCQNLPVVIFTSGDRYQAAKLASAHGVAACLTKSISAGELKTVLHELFRPKLALTNV